MTEIKITYKDGQIDWFSPCDEIIIDNGYHQYKVKVNKIKTIEAHEIED